MQYRLRELRLSKGYTLEAVRYRGGPPEATTSRVERGIVQPTKTTVVKLARGLGVSVGRVAELVVEPAIPRAEGAEVA